MTSNNQPQPDPLDDFEPWQAGESHDAFVQRALEHHARTGEWPPDPLLDEVAEMRRSVLAESGGDYCTLWASYIELDRQAAEKEAGSRLAEKHERPAA